MLWHVVTFRFRSDAREQERDELADALAELIESIDELRFVRVAPAIDEPDVLGLLTGFDDEAALAVYRDHPAHQPVVSLARELCADVRRLDILTADPSDALPPVR